MGLGRWEGEILFLEGVFFEEGFIHLNSYTHPPGNGDGTVWIEGKGFGDIFLVISVGGRYVVGEYESRQ